MIGRWFGNATIDERYKGKTGTRADYETNMLRGFFIR